jgi:predicted GIY-YIG superfamily endonuclease
MPLSFWVNILKCSDGSYYTGHTDNLEKRLMEHESGACDNYTSTRLPVILSFSQEFPSRIEELVSERQIKGLESEEKRSIDQG